MKQNPVHAILFGRHALDEIASALRRHPDVAGGSVLVRPAPDPSGWITFREHGIATDHAVFAYSDAEHGLYAGGADIYAGDRTVVACRYAPFDGRFIQHLVREYGGFVQLADGMEFSPWRAVVPHDTARLTLQQKLQAELGDLVPLEEAEALGKLLRHPDFSDGYDEILQAFADKHGEEPEPSMGMSP